MVSNESAATEDRKVPLQPRVGFLLFALEVSNQGQSWAGLAGKSTPTM